MKDTTQSLRRNDAPERAALRQDLIAARTLSQALVADLTPEDQVVQSMEDASPAKWHLAHTTWFFETFILQKFETGYRTFHPQFGYLFNSYYEAEGDRHPRPRRGMLTRPGVAEIAQYRRHVDEAMVDLVDRADDATWSRIGPLIELGINHEQQHQELLLTDLLHAFFLQSDETGLPTVSAEDGRHAAGSGLDRIRRRRGRDRPRRRRLRLRQRGAAPHGLAGSVPVVERTRHQRRVDGLHRR